MLTIKDVLQSKSSAIWSVSADDTAYTAMEIMAEKDIGALLVIDDDQVLGIVSERDFARNIILKGLSSRKVPVKELMIKDIYGITTDKSIEECMGVMTAAHCRHMPVFENNRLIGIVTFGDIVKALLLEQQVRIEDLESYISCCDTPSFEDSF